MLKIKNNNDNPLEKNIKVILLHSCHKTNHIATSDANEKYY